MGSSGAVTKLARFAALDGDRTIEEYDRLGEAEAILRNQPSGLDRNISWRNVESVLNGIVSSILSESLYHHLIWSNWNTHVLQTISQLISILAFLRLFHLHNI